MVNMEAEDVLMADVCSSVGEPHPCVFIFICVCIYIYVSEIQTQV